MIVPLIIGFVIAGVLIGFAARDAGFKPFLKMAISGVILGIAFTGIGLLVSTVSRTRVQALVCALLAWGAAVFAFDLAVLGVVVSTKSVQAAAEIDLMCDATHVNAQTDIHAAFEGGTAYKKEAQPGVKRFFWMWFNPVDVFRIANLPKALAVSLPPAVAVGSACGWIALSLFTAAWCFKIIDL